MTAAYPIADPSLASRFLLALLAQVVVPGWLLVGRRLAGWDPPSRVYASVASGLLLQPLLALPLSLVQVPLSGWLLAVLGGGLAVALDRCAAWRAAMADVASSLRPAGRGEGAVAAICAAALLAVVVAAFARFSAPPHLYDASNHAFMALRIATERTLAPARLFDAAHGSLPLPYLLGWQVTAATGSDISRVAPYVACWYLAILGAALLPLALNLLWRAARLTPAATTLGALVAVANYWVPTNLFSWGGFGMILGLTLTPWVVVLARAAARRGGVAMGVAAAAAAVGLLHVHASEVYTAIILLAAVGPVADAAPAARSVRVRGLVAAAVVLLVLGLLPVLRYTQTYATALAGFAAAPRPTLGELWQDYLTAAAGYAPLLHWLAPLAWCGLLVKGLRRLAIAALAIVVVYAAWRWFADPVSGLLTQPYYRQWPRLLYLLIFVVPALVGGVLARSFRWLRSGRPSGRGWRLAARAVIAACVAAVLLLGTWPGLRLAGRNVANQQPSAPFTAADVDLARQLADLAPLGGAVANLEADGSFWAMHVSGRDFLDPCGWALTPRHGPSWREVVPLLAQRPWPAGVRAMRERGVVWVLVSDHLVTGATPLLRRVDLAADPRFTPVLANDQTTLYRIEWSVEP